MPFLKNTWYVAANAYELDEPMVSRMICNEQIVMFRKADGNIGAVHDRCPHRFVPLSMGKRVGDTLQCGYHGLRFDGTGACVEAPHDDESQKARTCVKGYAAVEHDKLIWLWLGDAAEADPELIPDFGFFSDTEKYTSCQGYSHIKGNYQLIADNLLDLSHIRYLHPGIHEGSNFEDFTNKVERDGDTVWSMLWRHHYHVDAAKRPAQQRDMGESTDFLDHKPIILKADAAGVLARRIMKQKIAREAETRDQLELSAAD